jgi:hypothetical protein
VVTGRGGIKTPENRIHWPHWNGRTVGHSHELWLCIDLRPNSRTKFRQKSPLQLCLELFISSNSRNSFFSTLMYTVKEKGGKPDRKPHHPPYGLRNPYKNSSLETSQDYAQKPQRSCTSMNSAS